MFDVLSRLKELLNARCVSSYKLSKISDTPKSTIAGWKSTQRPMKIEKLEQICTNVLGISLAQFFDTENELIQSPRETLMLGLYRKLTPEMQDILFLHLQNLAQVPENCSTRREPDEQKRSGSAYASASGPAPGTSVLKVADKETSGRKTKARTAPPSGPETPKT